MHAQMPRVTDQAEPCLVSQEAVTQNRTANSQSKSTPEHGIVDLYARRMGAVGEVQAAERQEALERIVVTQPFGRAFTAQPSYPPDLSESDPALPGGLAGLRRRLAAAATPSRKLATS
jgi:hypothetical protein